MNVSDQTHQQILDAAESERVAVEFVERGRIRLTRGITLEYGPRMLTIPVDFACDGASIPAIFWPVFGHPYAGSALKAALCHDYACRYRIAPSNDVHRWFYQRLRLDGCAWIRSALMYLAVRWFGPQFAAS